MSIKESLPNMKACYSMYRPLEAQLIQGCSSIIVVILAGSWFAYGLRRSMEPP